VVGLKIEGIVCVWGGGGGVCGSRLGRVMVTKGERRGEGEGGGRGPLDGFGESEHVVVHSMWVIARYVSHRRPTEGT